MLNKKYQSKWEQNCAISLTLKTRRNPNSISKSSKIITFQGTCTFIIFKNNSNNKNFILSIIPWNGKIFLPCSICFRLAFHMTYWPLKSQMYILHTMYWTQWNYTSIVNVCSSTVYNKHTIAGGWSSDPW